MPAMKLPFSAIQPGAFASAFPTNPRTGLPASIQGVETQARQARPAAPVLNTQASDRVAALGRMPAPMVSASAPAPAPLAPALRPAPANVNPLGGMDPRPLSARGGAGPMSYAPRGVGTNSPNAYAVGRNNRNFAARTMMAPAPMMLGTASTPGATTSAVPAPAPIMPGRDDAFWADQNNASFLAEQDAFRAADAATEMKKTEEQTAREQAMQVTTTQVPGTGYVIPFAGGRAMGTLPIERAAPQMTPDDIAAARAMGGNVTMRVGDAQVDLPGMKTASAPGEMKLPKIYQGKADLNGNPGRDYYYEPDAQGKPRKVYIQDANEDGVPDNQQTGTVAATMDPAARINAVRKRLGLPAL